MITFQIDLDVHSSVSLALWRRPWWRLWQTMRESARLGGQTLMCLVGILGLVCHFVSCVCVTSQWLMMKSRDSMFHQMSNKWSRPEGCVMILWLETKMTSQITRSIYISVTWYCAYIFIWWWNHFEEVLCALLISLQCYTWKHRLESFIQSLMNKYRGFIDRFLYNSLFSILLWWW